MNSYNVIVILTILTIKEAQLKRTSR